MSAARSGRLARVAVLAVLLALFGAAIASRIDASAARTPTVPYRHLNGADIDPVTTAPTKQPAVTVGVRQLVTVQGSTPSATTATVRLWESRNGGAWHPVGAPMAAHVGADGFTAHPHDGYPATPLGEFTLTQAFGGHDNSAHQVTRLAYRQSTYGDSWGADPAQPSYNRLWNCDCDGGELYAHRDSWFEYGVVIDYNRAPVVPGAGSGFFLHVTDGSPTAGCVALARADVQRLLAWLDPADSPRVRITAGG